MIRGQQVQLLILELKVFLRPNKNNDETKQKSNIMQTSKRTRHSNSSNKYTIKKITKTYTNNYSYNYKKLLNSPINYNKVLLFHNTNLLYNHYI